MGACCKGLGSLTIYVWPNSLCSGSAGRLTAVAMQLVPSMMLAGRAVMSPLTVAFQCGWPIDYIARKASDKAPRVVCDWFL